MWTVDRNTASSSLWHPVRRHAHTLSLFLPHPTIHKKCVAFPNKNHGQYQYAPCRKTGSYWNVFFICFCRDRDKPRAKQLNLSLFLMETMLEVLYVGLTLAAMQHRLQLSCSSTAWVLDKRISKTWPLTSQTSRKQSHHFYRILMCHWATDQI